ncbi:MAG: putative TPR repeat methyltransferase [Yoonia sp.]|jgi:predicted TPR repeat methyltransferase
MARSPNLNDAYAMSSQKDVKELYRDWAPSYDSGFGDAQGYQLPRMVAQAFVAAGGMGPVLDVGAGTGLVAEQLIATGVRLIDGLDLSDDMLAVARMKNVYRDLHAGDVTAPLTLPEYNGVVSAGTFTLGHVGPAAISNLLDVAASGAVFVISVNSAHFEAAGFAVQMDAFGGQLKGLTLNDVRIYDDRADETHRNDIARLMVFKKA